MPRGDGLLDLHYIYGCVNKQLFQCHCCVYSLIHLITVCKIKLITSMHTMVSLLMSV